MCCTSLRNLLCNLELRSIEARIGKPLKELRHYNLKLAQPSRVTVYKQAEQLFGLRHKPITLQDALPKSDPSRDNLPRPDPLSLAETSHLSSSRSRISKHHYRRVEALTINPEATID
ncbi:hypothetical protein V6N11_016401 [Hibiscus sabdariffa]|uniref:Uncharacterized protein n=1 Tax=Hibiscus sabdariffa TaxID=183260 RepID=A0ABR2TV41_9ROSI